MIITVIVILIFALEFCLLISIPIYGFILDREERKRLELKKKITASPYCPIRWIHNLWCCGEDGCKSSTCSRYWVYINYVVSYKHIEENDSKSID